MLVFQLPSWAGTHGTLAVTRRVLLRHADAVRPQLEGQLLKVDHTSRPGDPAGHGWYAQADIGVNKEQVTAFLSELLENRKLLNWSAVPRIVDRPDSRSLYYFGRELFRVDARTGMLHTDVFFNRVHVFAAQVDAWRMAFGKHLLSQALQEQFGLHADEADLSGFRDTLFSHRTTRTGREVPCADPTLAPAFALAYGFSAFARHRLLGKENCAAKAAVFTRLLRRSMLDSRVCELAGRASGSGSYFLAAEYNQVVFFRALYEQVERETSNLLPLLHLYLQTTAEVVKLVKAHAKSMRGDSAGRARGPRAATFEAVANGFFALRRNAMAQGVLSKSDWKTLLTCGRASLKSLVRRGTPGSLGSARFLDQLRIAGKDPAPYSSAVREVLASFHQARAVGMRVIRNTHLAKSLESVEAPFHRVAAAHAAQALRVRRIYVEHIQGREAGSTAAVEHSRERASYQKLCDWLRFEGYEQGQPRRGSTWETLCALSEGWHLRNEQVGNAREQGGNARELYAEQAPAREARLRARHPEHANPQGDGWRPWFEEAVLDGVRVVPLHTWELLDEEAERQHHCVYAFDQDCWSGETLLFHLALEEQPRVRSTLELRRHRRGGSWAWQVGQHYAACNEPVDGHLAEVGAQVAARVNANYRNPTEQANAVSG